MPTTKNPSPTPLVHRALVSAGAALLVLLALTAPALAQQNSPMDFSDADEQLVDWPFSVVEYWVEDDGMNVFQHTRVQESPEDVYETLNQMKLDGDWLGDFAIIGAGRLAEPRNYSFVINTSNLRYMVTVRPDGAGAELVVKTTPSAIRSGFFKRALYPYRLGDNQTVRCERHDNLDE